MLDRRSLVLGTAAGSAVLAGGRPHGPVRGRPAVDQRGDPLPAHAEQLTDPADAHLLLVQGAGLLTMVLNGIALMIQPRSARRVPESSEIMAAAT